MRHRSFYAVGRRWVSSGFMGRTDLLTPGDFEVVCDRMVAEVHDLVSRCVAHPEPDLDVLADLDAISDAVCQVVDVAEFCRNVRRARWRGRARAALN